MKKAEKNITDKKLVSINKQYDAIFLYQQTTENCSKITTEIYSSSFSKSIKLLHKSLQQSIFNIYGFVRFADEIVDTFHQFDKSNLLSEFKQETFKAIERGLSLNPILNSFQFTVNKYNINKDYINSFFISMENDLENICFTEVKYKNYIYGSAEVVGLMCLQIFSEGDENIFNKLKPAAQFLGAAFQKVNFLRDIKTDYQTLQRNYFPNIDFNNFTNEMKINIENEITNDFKMAVEGIKNLPKKAKFGVYVAYLYYLNLFKKIQKLPPNKILEQRIRINNLTKIGLIFKAKFNYIINYY